MTHNVTPSSLDGRDIRQRELVPPQRLAACRCLVIGVGAVGRQVALQLAAMGAARMTLIDDDRVGVENLAVQGYWPTDLGQFKVLATAAVCRSIHPPCDLTIDPQRFGRSTLKRLRLLETAEPSRAAEPLKAAEPSKAAAPLKAPEPLACFCCVDRIDTRRLIWEAVQSHIAFWADGRMAAETLRVLAADHPPLDRRYETTLFGAAQAHAGSCTAKSTLYAASIAAGLMLTQFSRWLRRIPVEADQTLNLLAAELTVGSL